jgi:antitoxin MazE
MQTQVGRWGDNLAIRIPDAYAKELGLKEGMDLAVSVVDGALLLRPGHREHSLDELVDDIMPENLHQETDWGSRTGCESW